MMQSNINLAEYIDHTLLKPDSSQEQFLKLCDEAKEFGFFSVCVPPTYVSFCKEQLKDSSVKVCTVVGFPLGFHDSDVKSLETRVAIAHGADEIDMVLNISALKNKEYTKVRDDISAVTQSADHKTVKVILETCLLKEEEITKACELCLLAGAQFVKTSTGFSKHGATLNAVEIMNSTIGGKMKIKASGGIKTQEQALDYIKAGASRLGTSSGVQIIKGQDAKGDY